MKSNELLEEIYNGRIEEGTLIEVKTEDERHIAYITYSDKKLNWSSGEFDTRYLCDMGTKFEIVKNPWKIEKLNLDKKLTGEKIILIDKKINELIDKINQMNEMWPF